MPQGKPPFALGDRGGGVPESPKQIRHLSTEAECLIVVNWRTGVLVPFAIFGSGTPFSGK